MFLGTSVFNEFWEGSGPVLGGQNLRFSSPRRPKRRRKRQQASKNAARCAKYAQEAQTAPTWLQQGLTKFELLSVGGMRGPPFSMLKQVFSTCILKHIDLTRLGTDNGAADFRRSAHATDPATATTTMFFHFFHFFSRISKF